MERPPLRKLALLVEYVGTPYHGFQFQTGVPTVQGDIERALARLTGERIRIVGAGRTDAGVHAEGQVVSFGTDSGLSIEIVVRALNSYLRPDVAVKAATEVALDFNARRDAVSREYRYTLINSATPSPVRERYAYHVAAPLATDAMNEACQCLLGKHDFASFTGPTGRRTVREVYKAEISRQNELVFFDMVANSFLPKQVRSTMGALIRVGLRKLTLGGFTEILEARKPGLAAPVVPAHGLCLMIVNYRRNIFG